MQDDPDWPRWSGERQQRIEEVLERTLSSGGAFERLADAMRYATLGGGKRVRPLLAYAAGEFARADPAIVDAPAAAVELIHAYSLIHDDLPSMDNDTLRRGKPTCHVAFDEATALLAGDALQSLAFAVLGRSSLRHAGAACALLADAAGADGMAGGQAIDLAVVGSTLTMDVLEDMHRRKTGALILAAVRLGAACGEPLGENECVALDRYARAAGLAFQVIDDVLDVVGSAERIGKTAGKDSAQGKPTYVALLGVDQATRRAHALRDQAHTALNGFGGRGRRLQQLADWIVLRQH